MATSRRDLLAKTVATLTVVAVSDPLYSAEALPFGLFEPKGPKLPPNVVLDRTLSYTFTYPLQTASGKEIPIVASRKPEKYSSAAPLVADARQRIVAEYVSLAQGITCSMFVGPVTGSLQRLEQGDWTASEVAKVVLSDRSAVRISLSHRIIPHSSFEYTAMRSMKSDQDLPSSVAHVHSQPSWAGTFVSATNHS